MPERFEEACARVGYPLTLRRHAGYDHGYYFISTFIEDHLRHHARSLLAERLQISRGSTPGAKRRWRSSASAAATSGNGR